MSTENKYNENFLQRARDLVGHIEAGRYEDADAVLGELTHLQESEMFKELGKLTRELHDTLSGFKLDTRINDIAEREIPDAKQRLDYVIKMTDQAAHKTLTAVEDSLPVCEEFVVQSGRLQDDWGRFMARDMTADQFRSLVGEVKLFMENVAQKSVTIKDNLNEVLIAQDFQDLTGQTIRRVMQLVQEVEESLVGFIRVSSGRIAEAPEPAAAGAAGLSGPQVPGCEDATAIKSQDEVDDLLSSLGF